MLPPGQMHEFPWLHVPWPEDGHPEKLQVWPHAPQFKGSVFVFVQRLLHAVGVGEWHVLHAPAEQIWFAPHACPQAPQLSGSACRSTQSMPHSVLPGQICWQAPELQS